MYEEPNRQIHLDFHTSEAIPGIGSKFSRRQFQESLLAGRVELINIFAKCHHGWCYYPTKIGTVHPNLRFDLLGEQIASCHEIGVKAPIYFTVGWSANDAETHPEWCMRNADGSFVANRWDPAAGADTPKPAFQWKSLCPSGGYHDLVRSHTGELLELYEVDGLWYDIYQPENLCYCDTCRAGMDAGGFDVNDRSDVERYRAVTIANHCREIASIIAKAKPEASIYFNGLTSLARPMNIRYRLFEHNTKNDLEDLPTTWGGYDKLPLRAKLFAAEGKPVVAMSGKFHTSWGEFGGFKAPEAIRFEAASMIAYGVRCNFGDQLHPSGLMDPSTYANIGHAFDYVQRIETYGIPGRPAATLGLWVTGELSADEGVTRMLLEEHYDFDVVRKGADLARFETVIVPSCAGLLDDAAGAIDHFLASGGTMVVLGRGMLDGTGRSTAIECGIGYDGPGRYDIDYTKMRSGAEAGLPSSPFLNYEPAERFVPPEGAIVYAEVFEPYFSRTYGTYCGHQNTPYRDDPAKHPAAFRTGNLIVCAHPLDRLYYEHGAKVHRTLFANLLALVHHHPMAQASLPSAGRITLLHQPEARRYVAHLLYGPALQRGRCLVIEDLPTLIGTEVTLRLPVVPHSLCLEPDGIDLPFESVSHAATFTADWVDPSDRAPTARPDFGAWKTLRTRVPEFSGHCAVVVPY